MFGWIFATHGDCSAFPIEITVIHTDSQQWTLPLFCYLFAIWAGKQGRCYRDDDHSHAAFEFWNEMRPLRQ